MRKNRKQCTAWVCSRQLRPYDRKGTTIRSTRRNVSSLQISRSRVHVHANSDLHVCSLIADVTNVCSAGGQPQLSTFSLPICTRHYVSRLLWQVSFHTEILLTEYTQHASQEVYHQTLMFMWPALLSEVSNFNFFGIFFTHLHTSVFRHDLAAKSFSHCCLLAMWASRVVDFINFPGQFHDKWEQGHLAFLLHHFSSRY